MRLLLLNQYFYPDQSATAQLLTELSEDLAAHHDVTVVTGRPSYNPTAHVRSRGLISFEHHGRVRVLRAWSTSFDRSSTPGRLTNYGSFLCASLAGVLRADRLHLLHRGVVLRVEEPCLALVHGEAYRAYLASVGRFVPGLG